ncbi:hypothetical protein SAMN02787142_0680 [Burkholderia sp. WP9]|nr:hypothetical protein SAMN02787142_0680 [Burkholderia sp. WP9]
MQRSGTLDKEVGIKGCAGGASCRQRGDGRVGTGSFENVCRRETNRENPQHRSVHHCEQAWPDGTKRAHVVGRADGRRGVQPRSLTACWSRVRVAAALATRLWEQSCRDRDRQGGANPAAVPARAVIESACKRDNARHGIGAGSPRCVVERVAYAARGSRDGTACREKSWRRRPSRDIGH